MSDKNLDFDSFDIAKNEAIAESGLDTSSFDTALTEQDNDISKLITAASSGLQGTTAGYADELLATYGALKEATTLDPLSPDQSKLEQFKQARQEYLPLIRKDVREIEEANPKTALAAEIVGGVALPFGALSKGAKGVAGATKVGLGVGSVVGSGKSEADLMTGGEVGQFALDTAVGGAVGAAGGAGVQYGIDKAGPLLSKGKDLFSSLKIIKDLKKSFKKGLEGKGIVGTEAEKEILKDSEKVLGEMADDLVKLNKETNNIISGALEKGKPVSTEELLNQYNKIKLARDDSSQVVPGAKKYYDDMLENLEGLLQIKRQKVDVPQRTELVRGETLKSGEAKALDKIKQRIAKEQLSDTTAEEQAVKRLESRFAKKSLKSEEPNIEKFTPESVIDEATGLPAIRTIDPNANIDAELIKVLKPGEVKRFKQGDFEFYGYKNDQGKINLQPITDEPAYSKVSFKTSPKETADISTLPVREVSPETLSKYSTSMKDIGETALETAAGKSSEAAKEAFVLRDLMEGKLRSEIPEYKKGIQQSAKLKSSLEDLFNKSQNILELNKNLEQNKFSSKLVDILGKATDKADADLRLDKFFSQMKEIDPQFTTKYEPKLRELADDFMLNKTADIPLSKLSLKNIANAPGSISKLGANLTGRLVKASNVDKLYSRLIQTKNDPVAKELATILEKTIPKGEQAKTAIIYALSQSPAFREKINEYASDLSIDEE